VLKRLRSGTKSRAAACLLYRRGFLRPVDGSATTVLPAPTFHCENSVARLDRETPRWSPGPCCTSCQRSAFCDWSSSARHKNTLSTPPGPYFDFQSRNASAAHANRSRSVLAICFPPKYLEKLGLCPKARSNRPVYSLSRLQGRNLVLRRTETGYPCPRIYALKCDWIPARPGALPADSWLPPSNHRTRRDACPRDDPARPRFRTPEASAWLAESVRHICLLKCLAGARRGTWREQYLPRSSLS